MSNDPKQTKSTTPTSGAGEVNPLLAKAEQGTEAPSLKQFIQKRIQEQKQQSRRQSSHFKVDPGEQETRQAASLEEQRAQAGYQAWAKPLSGDMPNAFLKQTGTTLNVVDTEDIAGIEGYLPTPWVRLRVIQQRLESEIAELTQRLRQVSVTGPEGETVVPDRWKAQHERLRQLEARHEKITQELRVLLRDQSFLVRFGMWWATLNGSKATGGNASSLWEQGVKALFPRRGIIKQLGEDVQHLDGLLSRSASVSEPGRQRQLGADDWSELFHQLDKTLNSLEKQQTAQTKKPGLLGWLNKAVQATYARVFRAPASDIAVDGEEEAKRLA